MQLTTQEKTDLYKSINNLCLKADTHAFKGSQPPEVIPLIVNELEIAKDKVICDVQTILDRKLRLSTFTEDEAKVLLHNLTNTYGVYKVLHILTTVVTNKCSTEYSNNLEAVIHRDLVSLQSAMESMQLNHPIRQLK